MTKEEYREHMRTYSRDTAVMSFVVYNHPSYQVLRKAGTEIVPWLLEDLIDLNWHCNSCYGFGYVANAVVKRQELENSQGWYLFFTFIEDGGYLKEFFPVCNGQVIQTGHVGVMYH